MNPNPYGITNLWLDGDMVIRTVAVILLLMSIACWSVMLTRAWRLFRMRGAARLASEFWHAHSFAEGMRVLNTPGVGGPFRQLAIDGKAAAEHHASNRDDLHGQLSLSEWVTESLRASIDDSAERLQAGLPLLASVGSTAPFVGLLGTVWGIYHALVGIGVSGQASIDKVAGPVGEALIMTALGLVVAIPAVLGYNALTRANRRTIGSLHRFARQLHAYYLTGSPGGSHRAEGGLQSIAETNNALSVARP